MRSPAPARYPRAGSGSRHHGDNTYAGTTTISDGSLQVGEGGTTGSLGTGTVVNSGVLMFNRKP